MKVERRLGLGTRVPPPKPAAEAQAVPRRFCCHWSLALGYLARAASVQMHQAEGQPPHLAPWRGGGACLTHGCCPSAKLCPWGCLFHRHSSPGGPVAALLTGLGLWAQEDHPGGQGLLASCTNSAHETASPSPSGPMSFPDHGLFHSESGRCLRQLGKAAGSREGLSGLRF